MKRLAATFLASGGLVDRATNAVVGEAGPEAVVPLDSYVAQNWKRGKTGFDAGQEKIMADLKEEFMQHGAGSYAEKKAEMDAVTNLDQMQAAWRAKDQGMLGGVSADMLEKFRAPLSLTFPNIRSETDVRNPQRFGLTVQRQLAQNTQYLNQRKGVKL